MSSSEVMLAPGQQCLGAAASISATVCLKVSAFGVLHVGQDDIKAVLGKLEGVGLALTHSTAGDQYNFTFHCFFLLFFEIVTFFATSFDFIIAMLYHKYKYRFSIKFIQKFIGLYRPFAALFCPAGVEPQIL